jgi:hypothetical protein
MIKMERVIAKAIDSYLEENGFKTSIFAPNLLIPEVQKQIVERITKDLQKYFLANN